MTDGSIRYSTAAETVDGVRGPMRNHCGDASYRLRSLIDAVGRQLFVALDSKLQKGGSLKGADLLMKPAYRSFSQLTARGSHLEHLHSYFPPEVSADSTTSLSQNNIAAMDFHTDAGLMIAMTTGYFSSEQPSVRSGLYLAVPGADGKEKRVKAVMAEDSLILLMGEGARNWLKPVFEKPFRAVPHAMVVDIPPGSSNSRAWFGKMYLPPTDAILPSENIPYSQYHQYESDYQSNKHHLPLACGGSPSYQIILQNQPCEVNGEPGVYCWTQCQSVSDLSCGQEAQCVYDSTGEIIEDGKTTHCMGDSGITCHLQCVEEPTNTTTSSSDYCYGSGTTMSMTGFFSLATDKKGSTPCVNLLFEEWTLDDETKFAFGCLGVVLLGVFIQYLTLLRGYTKSIVNESVRRLVRIFVFGVQVVLSYFLMLVAMTYSVELFCMVCVGLTLGYGLFHADSKHATEISADACCQEGNGYDRLPDDGSVAK